LLVRDAAGTWTPYTFSTAADSHSRPILLLDCANRMFQQVRCTILRSMR
jgi:hypothetical protein